MPESKSANFISITVSFVDLKALCTDSKALLFLFYIWTSSNTEFSNVLAWNHVISWWQSQISSSLVDQVVPLLKIRRLTIQQSYWLTITHKMWMSAVPDGSLNNLLKHVSGEKNACQCSLFHYFSNKSVKRKAFLQLERHHRSHIS